MSHTSIATLPAWVDLWGNWSALAEVWAEVLENSKCHAARYAMAPAQDQRTVPATGKLNYNLTLVPGSIILGVWVFGNSTMQITDVNILNGHRLFQEPITMAALRTQGANQGVMPSFTLLPRPYPVVGDGVFKFEFWDEPGSMPYVLLLVAEVTNCPVR